MSDPSAPHAPHGSLTTPGVPKPPPADTSRLSSLPSGRPYLPPRRGGQADTPATPSVLDRAFGRIGEDDRTTIDGALQYPHRAIALLEVQTPDGYWSFGTGWLASERMLVTAGHCLYVTDSPGHRFDGWVQKVVVYPGWNGTDPSASTPVEARDFTVHQRWADAADGRFDIGVVWLSEPLGERLGCLGCAPRDDAELEQALVQIAGYPTRKGLDAERIARGEYRQWVSGGNIVDVDENFVRYWIDTTEGQSGSPVYLKGSQGLFHAVAVHNGMRQLNQGVRLTDEIVQQLMVWSAGPTG